MGQGLQRVAKLCGGLIAKGRDGITVAHPPPADPGLTNAFESVVVPPGKRVVWTMKHTPAGSCISGYVLKKARKGDL